MLKNSEVGAHRTGLNSVYCVDIFVDIGNSLDAPGIQQFFRNPPKPSLRTWVCQVRRRESRQHSRTSRRGRFSPQPGVIMQEVSSSAAASSAGHVADGITSSLIPQLSPTTIGVFVAASVIALAIVYFRGRRIERRRLQHVVTIYADRQLLRDRGATVTSA